MTSAAIINWVAHKVDALFPTVGAVGLGLIQGGKIVAGVVYDHFTGASITATMASSNYLSKEFLWAIFDYPFNQLGVGKLLAYCSEKNTPSLHMLRRMGFVIEARVEGVYDDGAMLVLSLTKDNCVWLKRLDHVQEK